MFMFVSLYCSYSFLFILFSNELYYTEAFHEESVVENFNSFDFKPFNQINNDLLSCRLENVLCLLLAYVYKEMHVF